MQSGEVVSALKSDLNFENVIFANFSTFGGFGVYQQFCQSAFSDYLLLEHGLVLHHHTTAIYYTTLATTTGGEP